MKKRSVSSKKFRHLLNGKKGKGGINSKWNTGKISYIDNLIFCYIEVTIKTLSYFSFTRYVRRRGEKT